MLEAIAHAVFEILVRLVLWPVAILFSIPFVLIRAGYLMVSHKQTFSHAVEDGFAAVSSFFSRLP